MLQLGPATARGRAGTNSGGWAAPPDTATSAAPATCYDQSARPPVPTSPCRPAAKQGCDRLDEQGAPAVGPVPATRPDLRPPFPRGVHPPAAACADPRPPFRLHHRPRRQPAVPGPARRIRASVLVPLILLAIPAVCSPTSSPPPGCTPRPDRASAHPAQRITPASTPLPASAEQSRPARRGRPSITQTAG
jgi:hypothetical protein